MVLVFVMSKATCGYYSQYYLIAAQRGEKSLSQYEQYLRASTAYDSSHGRALMQLALYMASIGQLPQAEELQGKGMQSFRTVSAFEQAGVLQEKLGEVSTPAAAEHLKAARTLYEKAERVRPANVVALEHLMLMAYRGGDDQNVATFAEQLVRAQADNLNGIYLKALVAEKNKNFRAAYGLYQQIADLHDLPKGSLFDNNTIEKRLRAMQSAVNATP